MSTPSFSFVCTARNDNYGGNWVNRINAFMKVLAYQAERTRLPIELVLVEYNPVPDKPNLYRELSVPKSSYFEARFIVVPNRFHKRLPESDKVTVCEFIGKNIGIRRAKADWVVATNPDVLYGSDLFDFFASGRLASSSFYRINRQDTSLAWIDPKLDAERILRLAPHKRIKVLYNNQTLYVSWGEWLDSFIHGRTWGMFVKCPLFNHLRKVKTDDSVLHENAAGDFLLAHKDVWAKVRGYDEQTVGSGVLDSYIMYVLFCFNYKQEIIPFSLFHIYHDHKGVRYLASRAKFREDADKMLRTKTPYKTNSPEWGFPEETFEEVVL